MALRARAFHWERTPLGPPREWPRALRTLVRFVLASRNPLWISWGDESTFLYNDACAHTALGHRHPDALGRSTPDVWAEAWPRIQENAEHARQSDRRGAAISFLLPREGGVEEVFLTFSCTPVSGGDARTRGSLWAIVDNTDLSVLGRCAGMLHGLATELPRAKTETAVLLAVGTCLARESHDLPCTMTYLIDGGELRLAAATGLTADQMAAFPDDFRRAVRDWSAAAARQGVLIEPSPPGMTWPAGPWDRPAKQIAVVPLVPAGHHTAVGSFIAGLNPYRPVDRQYVLFVSAFAALIASALGSVRTGEAHRRTDIAPDELASVVHELRTPLNTILTWTQLLGSGVDPDDQRRGIETIARSARAQARLLDGLLQNVRTARPLESERHPFVPDGSPVSTAPEANLTGLVILVVDDDDDARGMTARVLSNAGADVVQAGSASDGLAYLETQHVDLIVSDIRMPAMDGYSFMASVRHQPEGRVRSTPAIALSSLDQSIDRQRALRAGFQMHLAKPVEGAELALAAASLAGRLA